ncbi:uncharacterized protein LOC144176041 isoform X2 [Haemaphysalis longicornis]
MKILTDVFPVIIAAIFGSERCGPDVEKAIGVGTKYLTVYHNMKNTMFLDPRDCFYLIRTNRTSAEYSNVEIGNFFADALGSLAVPRSRYLITAILAALLAGCVFAIIRDMHWASLLYRQPLEKYERKAAEELDSRNEATTAKTEAQRAAVRLSPTTTTAATTRAVEHRRMRRSVVRHPAKI